MKIYQNEGKKLKETILNLYKNNMIMLGSQRFEDVCVWI